MTEISFFCSKDCADLCRFTITRQKGKLEFTPGAHGFLDEKFFCSKLKGFYEREVLHGSPSFIIENNIKKQIPDNVAAGRLADKIKNTDKDKILYLRGSGSLGVMMDMWDVLTAKAGVRDMLSAEVCDGMGNYACEADFGSVSNPEITNIENCEAVIIFGRNAKASNVHFYTYLKKLKKQGLKIIYIDPVQTETSEIADRYIRIKRGFDGHLAAWLMNSLGVDEYDVSLEDTGVSLDDAEYIKENIINGKTAFVMGWGLQRYKNGISTVRLINRLGVKTNNENTLYFGRSSKEGLERPQTEFNEILLDEALDRMESGYYELFINVAANPAVTFPQSNRWQKALKNTFTATVGPVEDETAARSNLFVGVGGMFAQYDAMTSYFFHCEEAVRRSVHPFRMSDTDLIAKLVQMLRLDVEIPSAKSLKFEDAGLVRRYKDQKIFPETLENGSGVHVLSGSHPLYLNSQVPKSAEGKDLFIYLSKDAAEKYSVSDEGLITLKNQHGQVVGIAKITETLPENTAFIYKSRELNEGWVNMLTPIIHTENQGGLSLYDVYAEVCPVDNA